MATPAEMMAAVAAGDAARVNALLADDESLASARGEDGVSAVLLARYRFDRPTLDALLAADPELDLFEASAVGRVDRVRTNIDDDPESVHRLSPDGYSALHLAAFFGKPEIARLLLDAGAAVDPAHDPEIDHRDPAVGQSEQIALVKVGMEKAVDHRLAKECAHQDRGERLAVVAGGDQRIAVVQFFAVEPLEGQHPPRGAPPVDFGHEEARLGDHVLAQLGGRRGLALEIELARRPLLEMGDDQPRPQSLEFAAAAFDMGGRPFVGLDRVGEFLFDSRSEHLDRDVAALGGHGAVDLGNRGGADRFGVEARIELIHWGLERGFDRRLDRCERGRRQIVLELRKVFSRPVADQVGARRQRLAELDRGRPDFLQRPGVIGSRRNLGREARDPRQPADLRRGQRIGLDAPQRAMARERPPPFEQPPQMSDRSGQWTVLLRRQEPRLFLLAGPLPPQGYDELASVISSSRCGSRPIRRASAPRRCGQSPHRRSSGGTLRGAGSGGSIGPDSDNCPRRQRPPCRGVG